MMNQTLVSFVNFFVGSTETVVVEEAVRRRKKGGNNHNESAGWSLNEMSRAQNVLIISVIVLFAVAAVFIHR